MIAIAFASLGMNSAGEVRVGDVELVPWRSNVVRVIRNRHAARLSPAPAVVATPGKVPFRRLPYGLETAELVATVNPRTQAVIVKDRKGHILVSEAGDVSQQIKAADIFQLNPTEAIFGLGQHQEGAFDYRDDTVLLAQRNMEVAVPLLVSSAGYGLFWNNASRTLVDAAGPEIVGGFLDEHGDPGGLTGHYFKGRNFEVPVFARKDPKIDFDWSTIPPPGLPHDDTSVFWKGFLVAHKTNTYTFHASADDGVRVWVDGQKVLDDWSVHPVRPVSARVHLTAGKHTLRVDYFQAGGQATIQFGWQRGGDGKVSWRSESGPAADYFVIAGPSLDRVIAGYRWLTGPAPMPPKWALGYWQSKERYKTQDEWFEIARGYRDRHLPIDALVQDWFYWDPYVWGTHQFDQSRYPDPAGAIQRLHQDFHLHLMISVWGKFNPGNPNNPNPNYDALSSAGFLYPSAVADPDRYYDAFNAKARAMYWSQLRDALFSKGIDAWWLDASEPEANTDELAKIKTGLGIGRDVLNAWPLLHTQGVYQGQRAATNRKRVFILTRSAYAGQQRNGAATWSGDITASWDTLRCQVAAGLNFCLSGIPYWTTDIGAFFVNYPGGSDNPEYRELYTRWFEYGAFCPIFRSHGTNTPREMWRFGPEIQRVLLKYDRLRYRLMPYIYTQAWHVTHDGGTIMRALAMDFPNDPKAIHLADEFMFGPSLLVCPVLKAGVTSRNVYLPAGTDWYDFWTGRRFSGGRSIATPAALDTMPIFVRSGTLLPLGPDIEYANQKADPLEIRYYPGSKGRSVAEIYDDASDGYEYEKGWWAVLRISATRSGHSKLKRFGTFPGMQRTPRFRFVTVRPDVGGVEPITTTPVQ